MQKLSVIVLAISLAFMAGAGAMYLSRTAWVSDMANQPSIKPQERPYRPPEHSMPTGLMGDPAPEPSMNIAAESETMGHQHGPGAAHDHGSQAKVGAAGKAHAHVNQKGSGQGHDHSSHAHGGAHSPTRSMAGHGHGDHEAATARRVPSTPASIKQGEDLFKIYCAVCHGEDGQGGMPIDKALAGIPKFTAPLLRRESDPHLFSMVTSGHGPMPGYAEALTPDERWHVINYLRTMQNQLAQRERERGRK